MTLNSANKSIKSISSLVFLLVQPLANVRSHSRMKAFKRLDCHDLKRTQFINYNHVPREIRTALFLPKVGFTIYDIDIASFLKGLLFVAWVPTIFEYRKLRNSDHCSISSLQTPVFATRSGAITKTLVTSNRSNISSFAADKGCQPVFPIPMSRMTAAPRVTYDEVLSDYLIVM